MKCVSLFCGIGGFDLALTRLGHEIVYANEWDIYAAQTYEKNFCNCIDRNENRGEQKNQAGNDEKGQRLESEERQEIKIKKRLYEQHNNNKPSQREFHHVDTRDITTVATNEIPTHDILVAGFPCQSFSIAGKRRGFSETRGTLFFEIARILKDKRPRYFLLENVKGLLSHGGGQTIQTIFKVLTQLGYEYQWQVLNSKNFGVPQNRERVFIIGHIRGEPRPQVFPIRKTSETDIQMELRHNTARQISPAIRTPSGGYHTPTITDGVKFRKLTPVECERLQGFPDNWTIGSDTQRYKQLGNAVTVNVVYEILKRL